jgi:hypothetical protein
VSVLDKADTARDTELLEYVVVEIKSMLKSSFSHMDSCRLDLKRVMVRPHVFFETKHP